MKAETKSKCGGGELETEEEADSSFFALLLMVLLTLQRVCQGEGTRGKQTGFSQAPQAATT